MREKEQKILSLIKGNSPQSMSAKFIAMVLNMNYNTVRTYLREMLENGEIESPKRGYYCETGLVKHKAGNLEKPLELHGIKLECRAKNIKRKAGSFLTVPLSPNRHRHGRNHSLVDYATYWIGHTPISVTITMHKELIEVWVKNSMHPMKAGEFLGFIGFLQGLFPNIQKHEWYMIQVGLNLDYQELRLDGAKSITLSKYENAVMRIYNKEKMGKMRKEVHISNNQNERINIEDAMNLITGQPSMEKLKEIDDKINNILADKLREIDSIKDEVLDIKKDTMILKATNIKVLETLQQIVNQKEPEPVAEPEPKPEADDEVMFG